MRREDEIDNGGAAFRADEAYALELDAADALGDFRRRFSIPARGGAPLAYFCGNSLGLLPHAADIAVREELDDWARLAVDAHFEGRHPWYSYHETVRDPLARLVGARPAEVVAMNGLTVNLHLMLVSFYRPTATRHRILIEEHAFPSDLYAVRSQLRFHGFDPAEALVVARARPGESALYEADLEALFEREGGAIALALLPGVQYVSGQRLDLARVAAAAHRAGAVVGFDLAHAAGNVPLALHDAGADFAVWCSYKYLNAGPGAVAGCFVHERHLGRDDLHRFAGWWGNDPATRFRMHLEPEFVPVPTADAWQLSNPPILALAPLRASLLSFDEAGMTALRAKSERLTGYLEAWIDQIAEPRIEVLTPREPARRGCQISLRFAGGEAQQLVADLHASGIVGDLRKPDVVRFAPVPLYNSFHDVWRLGQALARWSRDGVA